MSRISLAILLSLAFFASASAESLKDSVPHVFVTGEASEEVLPDQAKLLIDIVTEKPTASAAANENAQKTKAVTEEIVGQGVKAADIQSQGFTLAPLLSEETAPRGQPGKRVVKTFQARNELSVLVGLDKANAILLSAIDSGSNEVRGVEFLVGDEKARLEKLRIAALKDAEQRAKGYVEALGMKLGRVIEIVPEESGAPREMTFRARAVAPAPSPMAGDLSLQPGPQTLKARLSATWAISH